MELTAQQLWQIAEEQKELKALRVRVTMLEDALRDAERVLEWGEPNPKPALERVRRALEEK